MDQRCEQARNELQSAVEPSALSSPEALARAHAHLEACASCRNHLKREAGLLRRLSALRASPALGSFSAAARESLLARLGAETPADSDVIPIESRRRIRWPAWTGAAAAVALLAGGLLVSGSAEAPIADEAFVTDFIQASLPEMPEGEHTVSQVASFYREQFGDRMVPARLLDAPVKRVAVCDVDGRRGAMVEYDFEGHRLVYYQLPLEGLRGTEGLKTGTDGDYNVARWGEEDSEHVLVSAMPAPRLETLAKQRMN